MEHDLVSIIMPAYNAEKYITQAIDSIFRQTYSKWELICVDDGSNDSTIDILKAYAQKSCKVKLIKQQNQHAGIARNNGLKIAQGEYVIFLDSDDVFEKSMLSELVSISKENEPDMILAGYYRFTNKKLFRTKSKDFMYPEGLYSADTLRNEIFQLEDGVPWNRFFKRDFIDRIGIEFQPLLNTNDIYFTRMLTILCDKIYLTDKRFVNYRVSNTSSLQGSMNKNLLCRFTALEAICNEMKKRDLWSRFKESFIQYAIDQSISTLNRATDIDNFNIVYERCRSLLICDLYSDIITDYLNDDQKNFIMNLKENTNFVILFGLYKKYKIDSVSKSAIEYRIGKKCLSVLGIKKY